MLVPLQKLMLTRRAEAEQLQQAVQHYSSFCSDKLVKHINRVAKLHCLVTEAHERAPLPQQQQQRRHLPHKPDDHPTTMNGQPFPSLAYLQLHHVVLLGACGGWHHGTYYVFAS